MTRLLIIAFVLVSLLSSRSQCTQAIEMNRNPDSSSSSSFARRFSKQNHYLDSNDDNGIQNLISSSSSSSSCENVGQATRNGCDDPMPFNENSINDDEEKKDLAMFDMWELARSWTPGFCAQQVRQAVHQGQTAENSENNEFVRRKQSKTECTKQYLKNDLSIHGLWPSYSKPHATSSRAGNDDDDDDDQKKRKCFWPQNCREPPGYPKNESFSFDSRELPDDDDAKMLAPAWYYDDLAKHEWEKHGTCAVWPETMLGSGNTINEKATTTLTQRSFYRGMFALAKELGTPKALAKSAGSKISIEELKKAFIIDSSSFSVAAFGCDSKCNFVQVVQCFERSSNVEDFVGSQMDCPCVGVMDSRYDNSCESRCKDGVFIVDALK